LFRDWLDVHFPDRAAKVMNIIRDMRGGKDNDAEFFSRMKGHGPWAELIRTRMQIARKKHGLDGSKWNVRTDLFVPPNMNGQLSLF
jgi:DNA repair photolyase